MHFSTVQPMEKFTKKLGKQQMTSQKSVKPTGNKTRVVLAFLTADVLIDSSKSFLFTTVNFISKMLKLAERVHNRLVSLYWKPINDLLHTNVHIFFVQIHLYFLSLTCPFCFKLAARYKHAPVEIVILGRRTLLIYIVYIVYTFHGSYINCGTINFGCLILYEDPALACT